MAKTYRPLPPDRRKTLRIQLWTLFGAAVMTAPLFYLVNPELCGVPIMVSLGLAGAATGVAISDWRDVQDKADWQRQEGAKARGWRSPASPR